MLHSSFKIENLQYDAIIDLKTNKIKEYMGVIPDHNKHVKYGKKKFSL